MRCWCCAFLQAARIAPSRTTRRSSRMGATRQDRRRKHAAISSCARSEWSACRIDTGGGRPTPASTAAGDLVFFDTLREPYSHVGIYLGNNRFIHAPSNGGRVEIVSMTHRYWLRRYNGARRIAH